MIRYSLRVLPDRSRPASHAAAYSPKIGTCGLDFRASGEIHRPAWMSPWTRESHASAYCLESKVTGAGWRLPSDPL